MEIINAYKTKDGKLFESIDSANYHEEKINKIENMNSQLESGMNIFDIFSSAGVKLDEHPVFKKVTKNTKLVIEHWQCKDVPGYKIKYINYDMSIYCYGDVGAWGGCYGSDVSIYDLARYANHEKTVY